VQRALPLCCHTGALAACSRCGQPRGGLAEPARHSAWHGCNATAAALMLPVPTCIAVWALALPACSLDRELRVLKTQIKDDVAITLCKTWHPSTWPRASTLGAWRQGSRQLRTRLPHVLHVGQFREVKHGGSTNHSLLQSNHRNPRSITETLEPYSTQPHSG
jgi:hypothetical protein